MDGLQQAALAFDTIDAGKAPADNSSASDSFPHVQMDDLFGDVGVLEVDEESPAKGGGDDEGVKVKRPKAKANVDDDDLDGVPDDEEDVQQEDEADEEADEQEDDDDDGEDDDPSLSEKYEVTVDGEPVEVTLKEALSGYIRQETFHRRLNRLNEAESTLQSQAGELLNDRRKYIAKIDELQKFTDQLIPKEPDWDAEFARDPVAARKLQKQYSDIKAIKDGLSEERGKVTQEQKEDDEKSFLNYRRGENMKLLQAYPHWGGKEGDQKMVADLTTMKQSLKDVGFTDEEIKQVYDSRMVKIAMKAARYDRLMANRIKPVKKGNAKPLNSGAGPSTRTAPKGNRKAQESLRRTGSLEAAASVFTDIISKPRRK